MPIRYHPTDFNARDYKKEVMGELTNKRELNALFLIHGYIEAYLFDLLFYSGRGFLDKDSISEKVKKDVQRLGFEAFLKIHLILNNIDKKLYDDCAEFNSSRNDFAHKIITINIQDEETRNGIIKSVKDGLGICKRVLRIYEKAVKKKSETIAKSRFILGKSKLGQAKLG